MRKRGGYQSKSMKMRNNNILFFETGFAQRRDEQLRKARFCEHRQGRHLVKPLQSVWFYCHIQEIAAAAIVSSQ